MALENWLETIKKAKKTAIIQNGKNSFKLSTKTLLIILSINYINKFRCQKLSFVIIF